jgi:methylmalonyl-CoA epimerase
MAFAYTLRNAKEGWNPDLRKTYFSWFTKTSHWKGGNSFAKFLVNIRNDALETVADAEERTALEALSKQEAPKVANLVMPQGPGKAYTVDDIEIAAERLRAAGVRMLYDAPKTGTAGSRVNFAHPKDCGGVLIELVEPATGDHSAR